MRPRALLNSLAVYEWALLKQRQFYNCSHVSTCQLVQIEYWPILDVFTPTSWDIMLITCCVGCAQVNFTDTSTAVSRFFSLFRQLWRFLTEGSNNADQCNHKNESQIVHR